MGAEIRTTTAKLIDTNDRQGIAAHASSDDDDDCVEPGQDLDPTVKSVTIPGLDHVYFDSDDDSLLSSESSLETGHTNRSVIITGMTQDTSSDDDADIGQNAHHASTSNFCTIKNPIYDVCVEERELSKLTANSVQQQADDLGIDECDDDGNYAVDIEQRSRLMAAALAASIPSNDSFSDDSEDGSGDGAPHARLISTKPNVKREMSTRVVPTVTKIHHDSEDLEWDEGSSVLSMESNSEGCSIDDVFMKVNYNVEKKTGRSSQTSGYSFRKSSRNSVEAGEDDSDDGSIGSERSDHSSLLDGRKPQKRDKNSASFSATSTTFKWSNVKTKIFYSFRALKASASSSSEGSRTISVKNLAKEITDDRLCDFFQDSGSILGIRIIPNAQSGLNSAYIEFESGSAARKAVQKSGKKLEGRVITCDTAYENSRGSRRVPGSGHGVRARSELFESDSASIKNRMAGNHAALTIFDPELQEGDAKFLSRFNQEFNYRSYDEIQLFSTTAESVRSTGGRHLEGSKGKANVGWPDPLLDSILKSGKNQSEIAQSVYYDAKNWEAQQSLTLGRKILLSWRRGKRKSTRLLFPWKWPHLHWWHLPKCSTWARRRSRRSTFKSMDQNLSELSVKLYC